ncbi:aldehyde dehydrogenase [Pontimonas salivibrio]|uniref:Aldehyde dehydrogenase n=1 Tax=Pontimonas salivibrio TaxID=1159327 RepID=A0A2L2BQ36_9MICO|nr:aldehyde dehydrogenase family protein [Pontimonas salivibrio]AVG23783.1 aldehyde dehydrogenase [Pontimonas salivibrio]
MTRLDVKKTYKLYIGGAFPRSESGYTLQVTTTKGEHLANVAQASRKDARDAVSAARGAQSGWAGATSYNRGQVLYRIAEMLEGRREEFIDGIRHCEGVNQRQAAQQVDQAIDSWVWYAGWADKYAQLVGSANPVAGPYFNLSVPEPTGVVAAFAPAEQKNASLLGLVRTIAPIIVSGNTVVIWAHPSQPIPAMTFAEVLHTSDAPGGVVNILTGLRDSAAPWLATHADVGAMDLMGATELDWASLEAEASATLKRVLTPVKSVPEESLARITAFTEVKTVWHTKAMG